MNNKDTDQTVRMQMCRLICVSVVRIWHDRFSHDMAQNVIACENCAQISVNQEYITCMFLLVKRL